MQFSVSAANCFDLTTFHSVKGVKNGREYPRACMNMKEEEVIRTACLNGLIFDLVLQTKQL